MRVFLLLLLTDIYNYPLLNLRFFHRGRLCRGLLDLSSPAHINWALWLHVFCHDVLIEHTIKINKQKQQNSPHFSQIWTGDVVFAWSASQTPRPQGTHSAFTFLGRLLCRVQPFAAEVTLRKHSCFSGIWCHHGTTPPVLIFNKDKTFISQLETVRAWQSQVHEDEINSADCFAVWFTVRRCPLGLERWLMTDEESLCPYQWAVSGCYDKVKCILLTHATWHTSHEWPQSVINHPSPRSHQGRHNSGSHSLSPEPGARTTESCLFSLLEPWKAVFLYQPTHIYWNNKPQSSTCTRLPPLTVIFMFTPLKLNRNESGASSPRWINCMGWGKTGVRSSKSGPR